MKGLGSPTPCNPCRAMAVCTTCTRFAPDLPHLPESRPHTVCIDGTSVMRGRRCDMFSPRVVPIVWSPKKESAYACR